MRKFAVCALLLALMAGITGVSTPIVVAQTTKKDKDTKKAKGTAGGGYIEVNEGKDGKFRFNIRNADGKYLGGSGPIGYATVKDAEAAIEELKSVIATAKITRGKVKKEDK